MSPDHNGTKLGRTLDDQGRKQVWLADLLGVHKVSVSQWVSGTREVPKRYRARIAKALNVPADKLFD